MDVGTLTTGQGEKDKHAVQKPSEVGVLCCVLFCIVCVVVLCCVCFVCFVVLLCVVLYSLCYVSFL